MQNKNEVVVTRALRLKLTALEDVPSDSYILHPESGDIAICSRNDLYVFYGDWTANWRSRTVLVYVFGKSFDDVAKWVAGGRKLKDLQGDTRSEWVRIGKLKIGQHAELVSYHQASRFVGEVILVAIGCSMNVLTGEISDIPTTVVSEDELGAWYWPVRLDLGDKIEIKAKENGSTKE